MTASTAHIDYSSGTASRRVDPEERSSERDGGRRSNRGAVPMHAPENLEPSAAGRMPGWGSNLISYPKAGRPPVSRTGNPPCSS